MCKRNENRKCTNAMPGSKAEADTRQTQRRMAQKDGQKKCSHGWQGAATQDMHKRIMRDAFRPCRAPRRKQTIASQETPSPDRVGTRIELRIPRANHARRTNFLQSTSQLMPSCKASWPHAPAASKCLSEQSPLASLPSIPSENAAKSLTQSVQNPSS